MKHVLTVELEYRNMYSDQLCLCFKNILECFLLMQSFAMCIKFTHTMTIFVKGGLITRDIKMIL